MPPRYLCHFTGFLWVNPFRTAGTHACTGHAGTKPCNRFNVKQQSGRLYAIRLCARDKPPTLFLFANRLSRGARARAPASERIHAIGSARYDASTTSYSNPYSRENFIFGDEIVSKGNLYAIRGRTNGQIQIDMIIEEYCYFVKVIPFNNRFEPYGVQRSYGSLRCSYSEDRENFISSCVLRGKKIGKKLWM